MNPRTRMVLSKMLNRGIFNDINGCISTGKEADVYHATRSDGQELAIKVYKTPVLAFKDRDRYVQGDYRFRHGHCKHNSQKVVKTWAEKEMRNLTRLKASGIRCPTPILLRLHALVMEFIGNAGRAAPRLKDAELSNDKLCECYVEMIMSMRTLYQKCKLVHGDLSEYNILYYESHLYIIDVSLSVDLDHPHALDFLRRDCIHVSVCDFILVYSLLPCFIYLGSGIIYTFARIQDFFKRHGVAVMTIRELFEFIVDPTIDDASVDSYLEEVQRKILARGDEISIEEEIADLVFIQTYIPKKLDDVRHAEEDVQRIISGKDTGEMYYHTITGLKSVLSHNNSSQEETGMTAVKLLALPDGESELESEREESEDNFNSEDDGSCSQSDKQTPAERKAARKENKKKVKEEKRESRKNKVPKALKKKKKKKLAKAKKHR